MPEPGSHGYDIQRQRLRNELDNQGIPDANATDAANKQLQGGERSASPALATERAAGPLGGRTPAAGDAGNVVTFRSTAFSDGAILPERYARDGENVSPSLEWGDLPDGTIELALLMEDRDAGSFVHWAVTGIDAGATGVDEGEQPPGTPWPNSAGERGYTGPFPPIGDDPHRYVFRLYALGERVHLGEDAGLEELRRVLESSAAATGTLTARFGR